MPWSPAATQGLSLEEQRQLNWIRGHSVAQNTWRTYETAGNLFKWFCKEKNIAPELPASPESITRFVLWLSFTRKVSQATIAVYLSGLRQLHMQHGVECAALRSDFTKMLLQGKKNSEFRAAEAGNPKGRAPATTETLKALKAALRNATMPLFEKRLLWTVCTILFFGALRSSEILCTSATAFDPRFCVCAEDIAIATNRATGEKKLIITVKVPKEEKHGANAKVEIFAARNQEICAVTSWDKWCAMQPHLEHGQPAFRKACGTPLTQAELNKALRTLLPGANISSHSFRIGAATEMGSLGFTDADIKVTGRWSSGAFERYVRKGKTRRSLVAASFSQAL